MKPKERLVRKLDDLITMVKRDLEEPIDWNAVRKADTILKRSRQMNGKKREQIALALALRDGHQPEDLVDWQKTIYAKQADEQIEREASSGIEVPAICPKCAGRGFTEQEHGLFRTFCDCEKGKAVRVEVTGEEARWDDRAGEPVMDNTSEGKDDSDSGIGPDNQPTGSADTSEPKLAQKPKAKKAARKRAK